MKRVTLIILLSIILLPLYAQSKKGGDVVSLVVTSDGATKEEATKLALRSAIEQAYGVFVSSSTTILNDELVRDEIATVSSGNIQSYREISSTIRPDGRVVVTLNATVSISNLVSYSESKGATVEVKGSLFGMNHSIRELNKTNEKNALMNMFQQIAILLPYAYTKSVDMSNIKENVGGKCEFVANVSLSETDVYKTIKQLYWTTLLSLGLKASEIKEFKSLGVPVTPITFDIDDAGLIKQYSKDYSLKKGTNRICLRNSFVDLVDLFSLLHAMFITEQCNVDFVDDGGLHSKSEVTMTLKLDTKQLAFIRSTYGDEKGIEVFLRNYPVGVVFDYILSGYIKKNNCLQAISMGESGSAGWSIDVRIPQTRNSQFTFSIPMSEISNISKLELLKNDYGF